MTATENVTAAQRELLWLDPVALATNPNNANIRTGELGDLTELAASIKAVGVLQALTVTPDGDNYRILAGYRRTAAAIQAGETLVPCLVRTDLSEQPSRIAAQIIENDQRSPITAADRARAHHQLRLAGLSTARMRFVTAEIVAHPGFIDKGTDDTLADLLGVKRPPGYGRTVGAPLVNQAPDTRLPVLILAQVAAAHETTMGKHTWRQDHPDAARWLRFLAETGYTLSPIEQAVADTKPTRRQ